MDAPFPRRRHPLALAVALALGVAAGGAIAAEAGDPKAPAGPRVVFEDWRLRIEFDAPVQAWSATDTRGLVSETPSLGCDWTWDDDRTLECQMDADPEVGRRYTVRVGEGLRGLDGTAIPAFEATGVPEPTSLHLEVMGWDGEHARVAVTSWEIRALPPEALVGKLQWRREDGRVQDVPREALSEGPERTGGATVQVALPADAGERERLTLRLAAGVEVPGIETPTLQARERSLLARVPMQVLGIGCGRDNTSDDADGPEAPCERHGVATMRFSREVSADALRALELPGLSLSHVRQAWSSGGIQRPPEFLAEYRITAQAGEHLALAIDALPSEDGLPLRAPWQATLEVQPSPPGLLVGHPRQRLRLGEDPLPTWTGVDSPATRQRWMRLDADGLRTGLARVGRERDEGALAPHPASVRRLRERGGLLTAQMATGDGDFDGQSSVHLLWAEHAVTVHRSGDERLAWVTRFDDATPVPGLRVDWLALKGGEVLATATTDADGVARAVLPEDAPAIGWVRAGARTVSVLPLEGHGTPIREARGGGWSRGGRAGRFDLGLVDRPYARPGEAIHWRLLGRERGARGAVQPAPFVGTQMLALFDGFEIRQAWQAEPDAEGGLAGRLVLPESLPDGTWCIRAGAEEDEEASAEDSGACVQVGSAESRASWIDLAAPEAWLRRGSEATLAIEAGFLSGGAVAGGRVRVDGFVRPGRPGAPDDPALAGFHFLAPVEDAGEEMGAGRVFAAWPAPDASGNAPSLQVALDAGGRAGVPLRLRDDLDAATLPALIEVPINAVINGEDGPAGAQSPTRLVRVALAERFVGLRHAVVDDGPDRWEAIVVDVDGRPVAGVAEVRVRALPGDDADDGAGQAPSCVLTPGAPAACPAFDAALADTWRLDVRAEAEGAAPAQLRAWRWSWGGDAGAEPTVEDGGAAPDGHARQLTLVQPWAHGAWLLVVEHDGVLATHRVAADGARTPWTLPWDPAWPAEVRFTAIAQPVGPPAPGAEAARGGAAALPPLAAWSMVLEGPPRAPPSAEVGFAQATAAPGDSVALRLHNPTEVPLRVSVSVVDEGLLALAPHHVELEPQSNTFFRDWRRPALDAWTLHSLLGGNAARAAAMARLIPWPDGTRRGAAAPPLDFAAEAQDLDRIQVTGSRIKRADVMAEPDGRAVARPPAREGAEAGDAPGRPAAPAPLRLRQRFDDLAAWHDGLVLAPGETRTLDVTLPDGLTRWRARAWAEAPEGSIALAEASLESTLPMEARLSVPASLRRGDRARLTLSLRERERATATASARIEARGAGVDAARDATLALRRDAQVRATLDVRPQQTGRLEVTGTGRRDGAADGVLRGAPVLPDAIDERWSQAFWAGTAHDGLALPPLPPGADASRLQVRVGRLGSTLAEAWEGDLHAYPHRCIEQRLSRAIGAALALERNGGADWPDAQGTIDEAFRELRGHIDEYGGVHAWPGGVAMAEDRGGPGGSPVLAAWVLRALDALEALGHAPPDASVRPQLVEALAGWRDEQSIEDARQPWQREALAEVESVLAAAGEGDPALGEAMRAWPAGEGSDWLLAALWRGAAGDADARAALRPRLLAALGSDAARAPSDARWMGSARRDACALLEAAALGDAIPAEALLAPARRLADLWSGGHDSHAGATCLLALRAARARLGDDGAAVALRVAIDGVERPLALPAGEDDATLSWDDAPASGRLSIATDGTAPALLGVVATRGWRAPARGIEAPAGLGLGVRREYAVLRGGAWVPLEGPLRQDEIVRVHLRISAGATRHHVALVDAVPGGLEPVDPATTATPDGALASFIDDAWGAFDERQTGRVEVKLYAGTLWPGTHDVYWYARARHVGEYLAVPAEASLMYGEASRGRSEAAVIRIVEAPAAR